MPGSPPTKTAEPGTKPPPSTLSNSAMPVGSRAPRDSPSPASPRRPAGAHRHQRRQGAAGGLGERWRRRVTRRPDFPPALPSSTGCSAAAWYRARPFWSVAIPASASRRSSCKRRRDLPRPGFPVVYLSGEEAPAQVRMRASRLGLRRSSRCPRHRDQRRQYRRHPRQHRAALSRRHRLAQTLCPRAWTRRPAPSHSSAAALRR